MGRAVFLEPYFRVGAVFSSLAPAAILCCVWTVGWGGAAAHFFAKLDTLLGRLLELEAFEVKVFVCPGMAGLERWSELDDRIG